MNIAAALPLVAATLLLSGCALSTTSADATASPAVSATPSASQAPVSAIDLADGTQEGSVDVEVTGPTQVAFKEITLAPGAGTGLHCHYGQLIAVIESGELTHYAPIYPTGVHVYKAGDSLVEGAHYVHQGKNEGTEDVVLTVTYVIPQGEPLAETNLANCDPQ